MSTTTTTSTTTTSPRTFWKSSPRDFQKHILLDPKSNEPSVPFPLVLAPSHSSVTFNDVIEGVKKELAPRPGDTLKSNPIRKLLDKSGGAIYLKDLPLRSVEDFSQFLDALSGSGSKAWYPYDAVAMNVLRKVQAKNVLTVNEYVYLKTSRGLKYTNCHIIEARLLMSSCGIVSSASRPRTLRMLCSSV